MLPFVLAQVGNAELELMDKLLEARLTQIMGVGFVMIVLILLVFAIIFWRMLSVQSKAADNNSKLIDKIAIANDAVRAQTETIERQNVILDDVRNLTRQNLAQGKEQLTTDQSRISSNLAVAQEAHLTNEKIAEIPGKIGEVTTMIEGKFAKQDQILADVVDLLTEVRNGLVRVTETQVGLGDELARNTAAAAEMGLKLDDAVSQLKALKESSTTALANPPDQEK